MRRRAAIAAAIGLSGLALAGLLLFGGTSRDAARTRLIERVERATGRPVSLGRVRLSLLPAPALVAEDARLGSAPAGSPGSFVRAVRARTVTARPAWWPLLAGRIAIDEIALRQVAVELDGGRALAIPRIAIGFASDAPNAPPTRLVARGAPDAPIEGLPVGLTLERAELDTAASGALHAEALGQWNGVAWRMDGDPGGLDAWRAGAPVAFGFDGALGGAAWSLHGTLARPRDLAGLAATASLRIPDLSSWSPLAGRALPPWRDLSLAGSVRDENGLAHGLAVGDLRLVSPPLDLAGELGLDFGARPSLRAVLAAQHLDVDLLREALPRSAAPAAPPPDGAPPPAPARRDPVPDFAPDWGWLQNRDLDARIGIGTLQIGGLSFRDLALHAAAQRGVLRIDPAAAHGLGGLVAGGLVADTRDPAIPVSLVLRAPELQLAGLLGALALPAQATGALAAEAELQGPGRDLRGFVSGLRGHLGVSLTDGELSAGTAEALAARLPMLPSIEGATPLRCVALRIDAADGRAQVPALLVDAGVLRLAGGGAIDLADRTLLLTLRPALRLRTGGAEWDARLEGPWAAPRLHTGREAGGGGLDFLGLLPHAARGGDRCAEQLAIARGAAP